MRMRHTLRGRCADAAVGRRVAALLPLRRDARADVLPARYVASRPRTREGSRQSPETARGESHTEVNLTR